MKLCPPQETVSAFADGRLTAAVRAEVAGHVAGCSECERLLVRVFTETLASRQPPDRSPPAHRVGQPRGERYLLLDEAGGGASGMGQARPAYDTRLDRKVTLLFLRPLPASGATSVLVLAKAAAMARLSHPNVVRVYDVGMDGDTPYLSMELVDGVNLAVWRKQAPRSHRQIAQVTAAAARGLAAAHAAGIVHRVVRPDNILVAGSRVVVTDFGLSAELRGDGGMASTPEDGYLAPEQLRGEAVDARTDVFGLCATLFELLHGERPFSGTTPDQLREEVLGGRVRETPSKSPVPTRLHRLAICGLDPDPARRPPDMVTLAEQLLADPARRRRNTLLAVAGAAVVGAAFWAGSQLTAHPERQCRAGAQIMTATWNEGRRAKLGQHYVDAGVEASWPVLRGRIDRYADSWRTTYGDTCQATYGKRVLTDEVFDLRMRCFDNQRGIMEAFLSALVSATPGQLLQAAASNLPSIADCQFTARPETKPRPGDPASRDRIAGIEKQLARSLAESNLGDYDRAAATATTALAAARKLAYEPLVAESLVRLGTIGNLSGGGGSSSGGLEQTAKQLEEAYTWAEQGRDNRLRLAAAREQTATQLRIGDIPEAARWGRLAEALLSRLGSPAGDATLVAANAGWIHFHSGHHDQAAVEFRRSIDWSHKMAPPDPGLTAAAQGALCLALESEPGAEETIACVRKALAAAIEAYGPEHPRVGVYYGNLAYEMLETRKHLDEGCTLLRKAIQAQRTVDPTHPNVMSATLNLSTCLERQERNQEARRVLEGALLKNPLPVDKAELEQALGSLLIDHFDVEAGLRALAKARDDFRAVDGPNAEGVLTAHHLIAGALLDQGRKAEAQKVIDTAVAIVPDPGIKMAVVADVRADRTRVLLARGQYGETLQEARRAIGLLREHHEKEFYLAVPVCSRGLALLALGRLDEAVATLERGLAAFASAGDFQLTVSRADIQSGLARALMRKGVQRERACKLGREAAEVYRPLLGKRLVYREQQRWLSQHRCST
jgi:tetratricopeptide (TPR) repeat protein